MTSQVSETVHPPPKYSADPPATTAHLLQTVGYELGHVRRHLDGLHQAQSRKQRDFHYEHASGHLASVTDHAQRLIDHLHAHYPEEGAEMDATSDAGARSSEYTPATSQSAVWKSRIASPLNMISDQPDIAGGVPLYTAKGITAPPERWQDAKRRLIDRLREWNAEED